MDSCTWGTWGLVCEAAMVHSIGGVLKVLLVLAWIGSAFAGVRGGGNLANEGGAIPTHQRARDPADHQRPCSLLLA